MDAVAQRLSKDLFISSIAERKAALSHRIPEISAERCAGRSCGDGAALPTKPEPFARQRLTRDLLTNRTPEVHQWALEHFQKFRSDGQFVPSAREKIRWFSRL